MFYSMILDLSTKIYNYRLLIRQVLDSSLRLKKQNNSCLTPVISKTEIERNCPCGRPINISYSYSLCLCPACFIPNLKIGYVSPFIRKRIVVKARSIIGCGGGIIVTFIRSDQGSFGYDRNVGGWDGYRRASGRVSRIIVGE